MNHLLILLKKYVEKLKVKNPGVEVIGEYSGSHKKILHRCLIHDYEWEVMPASVLKGHGCTFCNDRRQKTHEEYANQVAEVHKNIKVLEEYKKSFVFKVMNRRAIKSSLTSFEFENLKLIDFIKKSNV